MIEGPSQHAKQIPVTPGFSAVFHLSGVSLLDWFVGTQASYGEDSDSRMAIVTSFEINGEEAMLAPGRLEMMLSVVIFKFRFQLKKWF